MSAASIISFFAFRIICKVATRQNIWTKIKISKQYKGPEGL